MFIKLQNSVETQKGKPQRCDSSFPGGSSSYFQQRAILLNAHLNFKTVLGLTPGRFGLLHYAIYYAKTVPFILFVWKYKVAMFFKFCNVPADLICKQHIRYCVPSISFSKDMVNPLMLSRF